MSSDLFAAFGGESRNDAPENGHQYTNERLRSQESNGISLDQAVNEEDDFGDFEDATTSQATSTIVRAPLPEPFVETKQPARTEQSNRLPFKPKPASTSGLAPQNSEDDQPGIGKHPFAGKWDLLFEAGDDEYDAGADELGDLASNPEAAMAYSKRIIAEQEAAQQKTPTQAQKQRHKESQQHKTQQQQSAQSLKVTSADPAQSGPNKLRKKSGYVPPTMNTEVLFDVENISEHEDDDFGDFGDFETWNDSGSSTKPLSKTSQQEQVSMPDIDLLGLDPQQSQKGLDTAAARNIQRTDHNREKAKLSDPTPDTALDDDAWDDFETSVPPSQPSPPLISSSEPQGASRTTTSPPADLQPPANVPPPIILLSIFPKLFASAESALFETMAKLDLKQRQALLAHPASHQFLKGYLGHCTVLAHIIAGRKLRWKRDQRLSQSMRIGPAAAAGKGGMKLAGLDKSELAKEDREVVDVLRLWKGQVGKLRTAVTAASAAPGLPKLPSVPDIAEQMPVRVLKQIEGGVTAPHPCALCGLKREERVAKVDTEVEDSFGEWWVQGANVHVICGRFWEEFEKKLKSR